jgi:RNA polymerase sigma-70 factor, ECF subfamily
VFYFIVGYPSFVQPLDAWPELAQRANAGDSAARHELLLGLYGAVRKHIMMLVGSGSIADDAVQASMLAVHRGLPGFRGDSHPRTWALAIATRITLRMRKKESRYVYIDESSEQADFSDATGSTAQIAWLQRGLATLSPAKRDAFVLMGLHEMSATEAGQALGTFANTAASRFRHARAELAMYFSQGKFDEKVGHLATNGDVRV